MGAPLQRMVARNDPCPCGSGKRYKDCHGSLRADVTTLPRPAAGPKSRYRAPGDDWAALDDDTCDRLGTLMESALKHQVEERVRDAERLYRAVLEEAPGTHDALHMLGIIRLGLGDFVDAERLIKAAMALRPEYPAIASNWALVRRSIDARDRRGIEIVCEHALPLLFTSLRDRQRNLDTGHARVDSALPPLHLVGPSVDADGEAAWMTRRLRDLLAPLCPTIWQASGLASDSHEWQRFESRRIDAASSHRPRGGHVVLVGVDDSTGAWLRDPVDRVLVFVQAAAPSVLLERLRGIAANGSRPLTLVFDSLAKARRFGPDHRVLPPPVDFAECAERVEIGSSPATDVLRIATVGQDRQRVVEAEDPDFLLAIGERAGRLTIIDPGPLRYRVGMCAAIQCVPYDARDPAAWLCGIDLLLHRARPWWTDDCGRTLLTAMALGVPVVCDRDSVYAEYIEDDVDGWLYEDDAAALHTIGALRANRPRLAEASAAARAKARRFLEPGSLSSAYVDVIRQWRMAS